MRHDPSTSHAKRYLQSMRRLEAWLMLRRLCTRPAHAQPAHTISSFFFRQVYCPCQGHMQLKYTLPRCQDSGITNEGDQSATHSRAYLAFPLLVCLFKATHNLDAKTYLMMSCHVVWLCTPQGTVSTPPVAHARCPFPRYPRR